MKNEKTVKISESDSKALSSLQERGTALISQLGIATARYEDYKTDIRKQMSDLDVALNSLITNLAATFEVPDDWGFDYDNMCFVAPVEKTKV